MAERCPKAAPVGKALLRNHSLAFGGHSPNWDGAPATVVNDGEYDVPGLLYEITYDEIRLLDNFEGHPVRYERQSKQVLHEEGDLHEAHVYIKEVDEDFGLPPTSYLSVLHEAYHKLGFDREILERALMLGATEATTEPAELLSETAVPDVI